MAKQALSIIFIFSIILVIMSMINRFGNLSTITSTLLSHPHPPTPQHPPTACSIIINYELHDLICLQFYEEKFHRKNFFF